MFEFEDPQLIFNLQMNLQRSAERQREINLKNKNSKHLKGESSRANGKNMNNSMSTGSPYNPNATGPNGFRKTNLSHKMSNSNQHISSHNQTNYNEFNAQRSNQMKSNSGNSGNNTDNLKKKMSQKPSQEERKEDSQKKFDDTSSV